MIETHHGPAVREYASLWVCYLSLFPSVISGPLDKFKLLSHMNIISATLKNIHWLKGNEYCSKVCAFVCVASLLAKLGFSLYHLTISDGK